MKKFGTPIGAGPGSASVKVGLAAVGSPSASRKRVLRGRGAGLTLCGTTTCATFSTTSLGLVALRFSVPVVFCGLASSTAG